MCDNHNSTNFHSFKCPDQILFIFENVINVDLKFLQNNFQQSIQFCQENCNELISEMCDTNLSHRLLICVFVSETAIKFMLKGVNWIKSDFFITASQQNNFTSQKVLMVLVCSWEIFFCKSFFEQIFFIIDIFSQLSISLSPPHTHTHTHTLSLSLSILCVFYTY